MKKGIEGLRPVSENEVRDILNGNSPMMKFENGSDSYGSAGSGGSGGSGTSGCGDESDLPEKDVRLQFSDIVICEGCPLNLTGDALCAYTQKNNEEPHFKGAKFDALLTGDVGSDSVFVYNKEEKKSDPSFRSTELKLAFSVDVDNVSMNFVVTVRFAIEVSYDADTKEIKMKGSMYHGIERKYF